MANEERVMDQEQGVEIEIEDPQTDQEAQDSESAQAEEDINAGAEPEPEDEATEQQETSQEEESERYMRLMADFQNYKRRVENEKSDIYAYANEKLVTQLLEVLDNFERALEHSCAMLCIRIFICQQVMGDFTG